MSITLRCAPRRLLAALVALLLSAADAFAWDTRLNESSDPHQLYGMCGPGGSALQMKSATLRGLPLTPSNVLAITVLTCEPAHGGGSRLVSCPAGSPYGHCIKIGNDGLGNHVVLGLLELDGQTRPAAPYDGCPDGALTPSKLALFRAAGGDPRGIKGLVTVSCTAATSTAAQNPAEVPCPARPHPYHRCIGTPNDGHGNAVVVGVVETHGADDPHGLYGMCNPQGPAYGMAGGFRPRSALVADVGRPLASVRSIDLVVCNAPFGLDPNLPDHLVAGPCETPSMPGGPLTGYRYCIWGTDRTGAGILAGVR